jgi:hypothetical protein
MSQTEHENGWKPATSRSTGWIMIAMTIMLLVCKPLMAQTGRLSLAVSPDWPVVNGAAGETVGSFYRGIARRENGKVAVFKFSSGLPGKVLLIENESARIISDPSIPFQNDPQYSVVSSPPGVIGLSDAGVVFQTGR